MPNSFTDDHSNTSDQPQGSFNNGDQPAKTQPTDQPVSSDQSDSDVAKLSKRVHDSQQFIETLKDERKADRELIERLQSELSKRPSLDDIMEHINQRSDNGNQTSAIDPDELVNRAVQAFEQKSTQKEREQVIQSNRKEVTSVLVQAFPGEDIDKKVTELAESQGMTFDDVFDLAARSPKAALKVLGVTAPTAPSSTSTKSDVNTYGLSLGATQVPKRQGNLMTHRTDRGRIDYMMQRLSQRIPRNS